MVDGVACYAYGVFRAFLGVYGNIDFFSEHLQLVDCCGAIYVAGHQQRTHGVFAFEAFGQLGCEGGLTRTLQTRHKYDCGVAFKLQGYVVSAHERHEFVVYNLHHKLFGLDGVDYVLAHGLLLYGIDERLGHLVAYVGLHKGLTYVLKSFGHVDFGNLALAFKNLETAFKAVAEVFEH